MSRFEGRNKKAKIKKSKFDLSHERKLTMNMGDLVPIMAQEIVPGDSFRVSSEMLVRFAPMLAPVMHRINVFTHYFFVPNRIIWDEWEDFITGGPDGTLAPVHPYLNVGMLNGGQNEWGLGSLTDYLGIPVMKETAPANNPFQVSSLPFRAYQQIYNDYYRDQNLSDPIDFPKTSGVDGTQAAITAQNTLRKRMWEKDYYTTALPWAQRGGAVSVPGTVQPLPGYATLIKDGVTNQPAADGALQAKGGSLSDGTNNLRAETTVQSSTLINDLRKANRLQEWLERNARGGARYIEQILSHFGVRSSDARLQRAEYLGGGRSPVVISEVLSTYGNADGSGNPQGNMSGHGIAVGNQHGFDSKRFEEHGWVIGIMSVLPLTAYQQGIDKAFQRFDKFDYYWPEFATIGEQAVKQSELYWDFDAQGPTQDPTFGYQERYTEYKFKNSTVHGDFRENMAYYHEGRIFTAPPVLNENFVTADPSTRIFAVTDAQVHHLWVQLYNNVSAIRPMPFNSIPNL